MTELLEQAGLTINPEPDVRLSPGMRITMEKILQRSLNLNPYSAMFYLDKPAVRKEMGRINHLLQLALPFINNNEPLDIEKLATKAKVDPEMARMVLEQASARKLRDR